MYLLRRDKIHRNRTDKNSTKYHIKTVIKYSIIILSFNVIQKEVLLNNIYSFNNAIPYKLIFNRPLALTNERMDTINGN